MARIVNPAGVPDNPVIEGNITATTAVTEANVGTNAHEISAVTDTNSHSGSFTVAGDSIQTNVTRTSDSGFASINVSGIANTDGVGTNMTSQIGSQSASVWTDVDAATGSEFSEITINSTSPTSSRVLIQSLTNGAAGPIDIEGNVKAITGVSDMENWIPAHKFVATAATPVAPTGYEDSQSYLGLFGGETYLVSHIGDFETFTHYAELYLSSFKNGIGYNGRQSYTGISSGASGLTGAVWNSLYLQSDFDDTTGFNSHIDISVSADGTGSDPEIGTINLIGYGANTSINLDAPEVWINGRNIDTALDSMMVVVNHGADSAVARPVGAAAVYWIGTVAPTNAIDGDQWMDVS